MYVSLTLWDFIQHIDIFIFKQTVKSVLGKQGNGPSCNLDESVQLEMQLRRVHNLEPFKVVTYAACYSFKSLFGRDVCVLLLVQTKVVM